MTKETIKTIAIVSLTVVLFAMIIYFAFIQPTFNVKFQEGFNFAKAQYAQAKMLPYLFTEGNITTIIDINYQQLCGVTGE